MRTPISTDQLLQSLQFELREVAANKLRNERVDHTLQTTALVNEVYLKLRHSGSTGGWQSKSQFLRAASEAMRRILVDHARARLAQKRQGSRQQVPLDGIAIELPMNPVDLLNIHGCLDDFAAEDPIKAELVKLRIFGGLSQQDAAAALDLPHATADRYWAFAKARLASLIAAGEAEAPG